MLSDASALLPLLGQHIHVVAVAPESYQPRLVEAALLPTQLLQHEPRGLRGSTWTSPHAGANAVHPTLTLFGRLTNYLRRKI